MKILVNFDNQSKKYLPMLNLVDDVSRVKMQIKKQLMNEIINQPDVLKAYKTLEAHIVCEVDEDFNITQIEKEKIFSYEELLQEIVEQLTEDIKYYEDKLK